MKSKLKAACVHCVPVDCCFVVCMMDCACAHAENNIARLTKPFLLALHRRAHTRHAQTHTHSLAQADMCSAQPVITAALMWSLGGTEASYYCRFMTTFTLLLYSTPSLPASLPLSFPPSCVPWSCLYPPFFPVRPSVSCCPNPHPFLLLLQWDACLFLVCKPSWHIPRAKGGYKSVFGTQ